MDDRAVEHSIRAMRPTAARSDDWSDVERRAERMAEETRRARPALKYVGVTTAASAFGLVIAALILQAPQSGNTPEISLRSATAPTVSTPSTSAGCPLLPSADNVDLEAVLDATTVTQDVRSLSATLTIRNRGGALATDEFDGPALLYITAPDTDTVVATPTALPIAGVGLRLNLAPGATATMAAVGARILCAEGTTTLVAGNYDVTAVLTDQRGRVTRSNSVRVEIR